jgi:hypothetical protein
MAKRHIWPLWPIFFGHTRHLLQYCNRYYCSNEFKNISIIIKSKGCRRRTHVRHTQIVLYWGAGQRMRAPPIALALCVFASLLLLVLTAPLERSLAAAAAISARKSLAELRELTRQNFEAAVLVNPRPWLVAFTDGSAPQSHRAFLARVLDVASAYRGFVDIGVVNATAHPRLAWRFGFNATNATAAARDATGQRGGGGGGRDGSGGDSDGSGGGTVIGFRADSRGLGTHNRVAFDKWAALPANASSSAAVFKRLVARMLGNFVQVLSDGEVAETFFRCDAKDCRGSVFSVASALAGARRTSVPFARSLACQPTRAPLSVISRAARAAVSHFACSSTTTSSLIHSTPRSHNALAQALTR